MTSILVVAENVAISSFRKVYEYILIFQTLGFRDKINFENLPQAHASPIFNWTRSNVVFYKLYLQPRTNKFYSTFFLTFTQKNVILILQEHLHYIYTSIVVEKNGQLITNTLYMKIERKTLSNQSGVPLKPRTWTTCNCVATITKQQEVKRKFETFWRRTSYPTFSVQISRLPSIILNMLRDLDYQ